jgi:transcriptional regulator with XRE-family HTH domain
MRKQGLTGVQLSAEIGLSETSLSRILKGHSRPKQVTLTRLMKRLCENDEDSQKLLRSFAGVTDAAEEEPVPDDPRNASEERERIERWLEARTQAITFKNAVARELDKANLPYRRDVCEGISSVDFLVEAGGHRIALECKFNVARDFEKSLGIAVLISQLMRCEEAIVVVPYELDSSPKVSVPSEVSIRALAEVGPYLNRRTTLDRPQISDTAIR